MTFMLGAAGLGWAAPGQEKSKCRTLAPGKDGGRRTERGAGSPGPFSLESRVRTGVVGDNAWTQVGVKSFRPTSPAVTRILSRPQAEGSCDQDFGSKRHATPPHTPANKAA